MNTLLFLVGMVVTLAVVAFVIVLFDLFSTSDGLARLRRVEVGDPIVYRKQKVSSHPGKRAYQIDAAKNGDNYSYLVDKYWTVSGVLANGLIVALTRTNKRHYLRRDDPNLHRAGMIERMRNRDRFPQL